MKRNLLSRLSFVAFVLIFQLSIAQELSKTSPEEVGMSQQRLQRLTDNLQEYIDEGKLPGTVLLVARNGKVAYFEALGQQDMEKNTTMANDAIFRIASQTKALVSVGIMMLQEEGKLLITEPLEKYIPEFKDSKVAEPIEGGGYEVVPAKRKITLRDLLTHSAGIGYGGGVAADVWKEAGIQGWYFAHREEPILETVKKMGALPNEAHPGEKFVYGYNTDILGAVIEVVSGKSLEEFLTERIFNPLGMNDTHFYLPKEKKNRLATVYSLGDDGLKKAPSPGGMIGQGEYVKGPRTSFSGGAGVLSTANDYAAFLQMLLNKGTYNEQRLLSRKSVELMTVNHLDNTTFPWEPGMGFGLGFRIIEDLGKHATLGSVGDYGWGGAYHSTYWVDPSENLVVVYFTQVIPAPGLDDHQKLRSLIYQAIVD
jgi:CubicO group peptidase (beta-lactamase class C family)